MLKDGAKDGLPTGETWVTAPRLQTRRTPKGHLIIVQQKARLNLVHLFGNMQL